MVEGVINGFPFRATLEPHTKGSHRLRLTKAICAATAAQAADTIAVEITRAGDEPETRLPLDLRKALESAPRALVTWADITPLARREWILWVGTAKQSETRAKRIERARENLTAGKKRVCCFGGLSWLTKDHVAPNETWQKLPKTKN